MRTSLGSRSTWKLLVEVKIVKTQGGNYDETEDKFKLTNHYVTKFKVKFEKTETDLDFVKSEDEEKV